MIVVDELTDNGEIDGDIGSRRWRGSEMIFFTSTAALIVISCAMFQRANDNVIHGPRRVEKIRVTGRCANGRGGIVP